MIREAGAEYVIVGHSERRTLFGETDATVNRKVNAAFAAGLTPIACIGETLDQRERNETFEVLDRQIKQGLDGLTADQIGQLVIAYEPVWAIGTGRNATRGAGGRGARAHPDAAAAVVRAGGGRALPRASTAAASSRRTSRISSRSPTWTGRWWAGPAWTCAASWTIVTRSRQAAV